MMNSLLCFFLFLVVVVLPGWCENYAATFEANVKNGALQNFEMQLILNAHNHLRRLVSKGQYHNQPTAAGMTLMRWDDRLANLALDWALKVNASQEVKHRYDSITFDWSSIGENMGMYASRSNLLSKIDAFFQEAQHYDFAAKSCDTDRSRNPDGTCGHYLQAASAQSMYVGCQMVKYGPASDPPTNYFLVCNYGPGRPTGDPYESGPTCSNCHAEAPWCLDNLCVSKDVCDKTGKCECLNKCKNGAQLNPETCTCDLNCPANTFCTVETDWKLIKAASNVYGLEPVMMSKTCTDAPAPPGLPNWCANSDLANLCYVRPEQYAVVCPKSCNTCIISTVKRDWNEQLCGMMRSANKCGYELSKKLCVISCSYS